MKEKFTIEGIHYESGKNVIIRVDEGFIVSIDEAADVKGNNKHYIAPGLIDNQINGYAGVDFSGDDLSSVSFKDAVQSVWNEGVTAFLPTLLTNSHENLIKNFATIAEVLNNDTFLGESVPGLHLEGPYISAEEGFRGCHPLRHIRRPSWNEFMTYQEAAGGRIIQITLAPEAEGAIQFIKLCIREGVTVAIGHTNANAYQISQAVDAGASISTHLGNGCANFIHRHLNPIWPQLADDRLKSSVIADGLHLTPQEIRVFFKTKGQDNLILASDVVYLAGMKPGRYTFLESEVELTKDGMLLNTELNCLAGASFPLIRGVGNIIEFTGCSLATAVNMASRNVSDIYRLKDRGSLTPSSRADIILFELKDNQLELNKTFVKGKLVFSL